MVGEAKKGEKEEFLGIVPMAKILKGN